MSASAKFTAGARAKERVRSGRAPLALTALITLLIFASRAYCGSATADISDPPAMKLSSSPVAEAGGLAHLPPIIFLAVIVVVALMFTWFVRVFTVDFNSDNPPDDDAKKKVRKMIGFCYVFMLLTLGVAISPVVILMLLPQGVVSSLYSYMPDSPVALVVGCVHDERPEDSHWEIVCQERDPYANEWLISIGGLVLVGGGTGPLIKAPTTVANLDGATGADDRRVSSAVPLTPDPTKDAKGRVMGAAAPELASASGLPPSASLAPGASPPPNAGAAGAPPPFSPTDFFVPPPPWTPDSNLTSGYWNFPNVIIHGGITVPLYFIIIALVGASISLTRKVPEFQKEFLNKDKPFAASEMREQLVLQILQFLSAPFLAIASYILITPSGPTTSIPLAFVAGFSSEIVLKFITSAIENISNGQKTA